MNLHLPTWWDIFSQAGILLSVVGYLMLAKKNRWGWVIGLASQPFWFYSSITNHQIGIIINTVFFSAAQLYGIWKWFGHNPECEGKKLVLQTAKDEVV